jgi:excisionase family DNA binding protein
MRNKGPYCPANVENSTASLLRVREVAADLAVSIRTVWRLIASGELAAVRIGRSVRITRDSLSTFIENGGNNQ